MAVVSAIVLRIHVIKYYHILRGLKRRDLSNKPHPSEWTRRTAFSRSGSTDIVVWWNRNFRL